MRLLTKIFGNRDDPGTAAGEGSEEGSPERQTIELEPYELSAGDEPRATSEQSGRVTFAPASDSTSPENADGSVSVGSVADGIGSDGSGSLGRRKRRRPSGDEGSDERPHELTRRRIARPTVATFDPTPPPIPVVNGPTADDPEEIDVSDQIDEANDGEADLDASVDLIIEDDEPLSEYDDEEEANTSVSVWGAAASGPTSSPSAASAPLAVDASPAAPSPEPAPATPVIEAGPHADDPHTEHAPAQKPQGSTEIAADGSASISPNTTQPDPERTRMLTDTKRPKQTLVEAGTEFKGTMKSSCPVVVHGTLDGDIDAPTLSIATTGTIQGNIRAETLRSHGTLAGTVDAGEVFVSGVVRSKTVIRARHLELQLGNSSKSQIEVTVKTTNLELSAVPSSPEVGSAESAAPTSDVEPTGNAGWDLPDAESGVEPVRARKRTTSK